MCFLFFSDLVLVCFYNNGRGVKVGKFNWKSIFGNFILVMFDDFLLIKVSYMVKVRIRVEGYYKIM